MGMPIGKWHVHLANWVKVGVSIHWIDIFSCQ